MNIDEFTEYLAVSGIEKSAVKEALAALVNDTENLNKALDYILSQNERWAILKNLNLQFKMLKGSDADSVSDLGLSYAWSTDIKQTLLSSTSAGMTGINLQASADGNVTFNEKNNPFNFLESSLSFHFYRSQGGAITATRETAIKLDSLTELLAMITNEEEYAQSPLLKELLDIHFDHMTTQYYLDLSVHGGMESNQAFTQKNYVLGTQLGFDLKAWNPNSTLAGWNVFDWPFALVRWMTGTDTKPTPLGTVFPTVLCGLDYIDPDHDSYRAAVGDSSGYLRINAETAFKTPIARTSGATVFLQADVRYFRELAPSDKVESADLEDYVYFTAALVSSKGFYAGYTNGKLPFDNQSDEVYEVGFVFDF
ncbi:MAG: hypothetical protein JW763_06375 [candidate division Zixibacteria bacterium]|nr:hypothetical protein [candidate division Zixibacteria bacterium]